MHPFSLELDMSNFAPSQPSLKRRVIGASTWSLVGYTISYAIRFASSLLMTRLLVPDMFGVMTIAMTVMTGLAMFTDIGLRQNIIQSHRNDELYLNTAWVVQIVRGALLWFVGIMFSLILFAVGHLTVLPPTTAYSDRTLPYVIAVLSFSVFIGGLQSTKLSEASRNLSLGRITQIQIFAQVAGLFSMVAWAFFQKSVWTLVVGHIVATIATTLLSHSWLPGVSNRWQWERSALHDIIHFGKWIFISSILGFFANSADRILLGGLVDSATLGVFSIAVTIFGIVYQFFVKFILEVAFPALSEVVRERPTQLKRNYYRLHTIAALFSYFGAGLLFISGDRFIILLYDARYADAGWMLTILAVAIPTIPFSLAYYCLLALGLPKLFTNLVIIRVCATVACIPIGFKFFGMPGAVWGIVAGYYSGIPATMYFQAKHGFFSTWNELRLLLAVVPGVLVGFGFNNIVAQGN